MKRNPETTGATPRKRKGPTAREALQVVNRDLHEKDPDGSPLGRLYELNAMPISLQSDILQSAARRLVTESLPQEHEPLFDRLTNNTNSFAQATTALAVQKEEEIDARIETTCQGLLRAVGNSQRALNRALIRHHVISPNGAVLKPEHRLVQYANVKLPSLEQSSNPSTEAPVLEPLPTRPQGVEEETRRLTTVGVKAVRTGIKKIGRVLSGIFESKPQRTKSIAHSEPLKDYGVIDPSRRAFLKATGSVIGAIITGEVARRSGMFQTRSAMAASESTERFRDLPVQFIAGPFAEPTSDLQVVWGGKEIPSKSVGASRQTEQVAKPAPFSHDGRATYFQVRHEKGDGTKFLFPVHARLEVAEGGRHLTASVTPATIEEREKDAAHAKMTIILFDEEGHPVSGAQFWMDEGVGYTDDRGKATVVGKSKMPPRIAQEVGIEAVGPRGTHYKPHDVIVYLNGGDNNPLLFYAVNKSGKSYAHVDTDGKRAMYRAYGQLVEDEMKAWNLLVPEDLDKKWLGLFYVQLPEGKRVDYLQLVLPQLWSLQDEHARRGEGMIVRFEELYTVAEKLRAMHSAVQSPQVDGRWMRDALRKLVRVAGPSEKPNLVVGKKLNVAELKRAGYDETKLR